MKLNKKIKKKNNSHTRRDWHTNQEEQGNPWWHGTCAFTEGKRWGESSSVKQGHTFWIILAKTKCVWLCQTKRSFPEQWCVFCDADFYPSILAKTTNKLISQNTKLNHSFLHPIPPFLWPHCLLFHALFWTPPCIYIHSFQPFSCCLPHPPLTFSALFSNANRLDQASSSSPASPSWSRWHTQCLTSSLVRYPSRHLGS